MNARFTSLSPRILNVAQPLIPSVRRASPPELGTLDHFGTIDPRRGGPRCVGEGDGAMDAALAQLEFSQYVKQCDRLAHAPALDRACLLISAAFDPTADLDRCIAQLDDI